MLLSRTQWLFTTLGILIVSGYMYSLDWPQTLEAPLRQSPYNFTTFQFNMLYLVTSLPIGLLNIPLGILIDRLPLSLSILTITMIGLLSQLAIALCFMTTFSNFYIVLLILRGIFGLSGEGAYTIQGVVIQKVAGKHYDMMMGFCLTVPLLFGSINSLVTTSLYYATKLTWVPLFVSAGMAFISLVAGLILIYQVRQLRKDKAQQLEMLLQYEQPTEQHFKCSDLKDFNSTFWFVILLTFLCQACTGPFLDNCNDLLIKRFGMPYPVAGGLLMIPFGLTPPLSLVWSRVLVKRHPNRRRLLFILITVLGIITHLIFILLRNSTQVSIIQYILITLSLIIFSLTFSGFVTLIIPCVSLIVPQRVLGTAFGASGSATALSQAFMPLLNSVVIGQGDDAQLSKNYHSLSNVYFGVNCAALLVSIMLLRMRTKSAKRIDGLVEEPEHSIITSSFSSLKEDISISMDDDRTGVIN